MQEVNHAPQFVWPIPDLKLKVWERDLILRNATEFVFLSPEVKDNEGDEITISLLDQQRRDYLDLYVNEENNTFRAGIDRMMLNHFDAGRHYFQVKLSDNVVASRHNSRW